MALNLQQFQKQTQRLVMTPQMQQSIQLLQMNTIELEGLMQQELLENPFLSIEEEGSGFESLERSEREIERTPESDRVESGDLEKATASSGDYDDLPEPPSMESTPEQFDQVDVNWDDYYADAENSTYSGVHEEFEERDFSEYVAARPSLSEQMSWQLRCSSLSGIDFQMGEYIIGSLDEDGYLSANIIEEIIENFGVERKIAERVLSILQEFDPIGVCSRSLSECLLTQMKQLGSYSELARAILEEHLEDFQHKRFRELARTLNVDESDIVKVLHKVGRLEPHPGRSLSSESVQYVQPDVFVKVLDGELMIYVNEGQSGRLSVNQFYRRLMFQRTEGVSKQDREYALEKYRAAQALIKNIEKRKSTILRITEAIMNVQRSFLDRGIEALKPLTLREIAEQVEMHESTVARVTSKKYVETPQGVYQLKFFFSSSIESSNDGRPNEAVSSRSVKDKIAQIIASENPKKPISDQKLSELLNKEGFDIARRTVAKYREQLKILPAKFRKQS